MNDNTTKDYSPAERAAAEQRRLFEAAVPLLHAAQVLKDEISAWCDLVHDETTQHGQIASAAREAKLDAWIADDAVGLALDAWRLADHTTYALTALRGLLYAHPARHSAPPEVLR